MQFIVHEKIFEYFPGINIAVAVAHGLNNEDRSRAIVERWRAAWAGAGEAARYGNAQSHPHIRPWGEQFKAIGVSRKDFPPSIEAILRRAMKGGEPFFINPLVDFYNMVSLQYVVPVGAFDLDQLRGPIELRLTRPGDTFTALREEASQPVQPGEVAYADGQTVLTRHFMWRQAQTGLIAPSTQSAFLVSEIPGALGQCVAEAVLGELCNGLESYFHVRTDVSFLVNAQHPVVSW